MGENRCLKTKKWKKKSYAYFSSAWLLARPLAAAVLFFYYGDLPKPSLLVFLGVSCALPFWKLVAAMHIFAILSFLSTVIFVLSEV
jgi:hypothetical protein